MKGKSALLGFEGPHEQQKELLVQNKLVKALQVRYNLRTPSHGQRMQDRMVGTSTGEEESHGEGAEVSVWEVLVV